MNNKEFERRIADFEMRLGKKIESLWENAQRDVTLEQFKHGLRVIKLTELKAIADNPNNHPLIHNGGKSPCGEVAIYWVDDKPPDVYTMIDMAKILSVNGDHPLDLHPTPQIFYCGSCGWGLDIAELRADGVGR